MCRKRHMWGLLTKHPYKFTPILSKKVWISHPWRCGSHCFSLSCNQNHPFKKISWLPGSNLFGKTPLFFRYSGVNAVNAFIPTRNAVNAVSVPVERRSRCYTKKNCVYKKSDFLTPWRMRNLWSTKFFDTRLRSFRAYLIESVGELQGVWAWTWRHW